MAFWTVNRTDKQDRQTGQTGRTDRQDRQTNRTDKQDRQTGETNRTDRQTDSIYSLIHSMAAIKRLKRRLLGNNNTSLSS